MDEQDDGEQKNGMGTNEEDEQAGVKAEGPPDAAARPAHAGGPSSYGVLPRGDPNPSRLPSSDGNGKSRYSSTLSASAQSCCDGPSLSFFSDLKVMLIFLSFPFKFIFPVISRLGSLLILKPKSLLLTSFKLLLPLAILLTLMLPPYCALLFRNKLAF